MQSYEASFAYLPLMCAQSNTKQSGMLFAHCKKRWLRNSLKSSEVVDSACSATCTGNLRPEGLRCHRAFFMSIVNTSDFRVRKAQFVCRQALLIPSTGKDCRAMQSSTFLQKSEKETKRGGKFKARTLTT